jgi:DNA-binding response OmpR family regulator
MSKARILVVDDDSKLSLLIGDILRRDGYEVREENRSFAVLSTAREFRPQLALLDVDMPGKDGGTVAAEMAADQSLAKVPVAFITSLVKKGEAGMIGGARFVSKPVEVEVLLETVKQMLNDIAA